MTKWITAIVAALAIGGATLMAAQLSNTFALPSCAPGSTYIYHFVNNQTGGASAGLLTATFNGTPSSCTVGPSAVNQNTQHFYCEGGGTVITASTNLPGRLVISGIACGETKCDPKTDPNGCEPPK